MYSSQALPDTIYGCGTHRRTRPPSRRSSCRPIRSRAPSRARWATCGTRPGSPNVRPRASSARRRRSCGGWRTRATSRRFARWRASRASMATSWRWTSRKRASVLPLKGARAAPAW